MLKFLERTTRLVALLGMIAVTSAADSGSANSGNIGAGKFGLGRAALSAEIAAWDVDVLPDGRGLPVGSGDVETGEEVFADVCASCHGDFAEGVDNWPVLAGGFDTLADKDPVKTVGSYWPHLSTVWDYVHRSMPFGAAQTLSDDDVYAIVAYILYSNDLVEEDFVLSNQNFADFQMYNHKGFIVDDRPQTEYAAWRTSPCMKGCKQEVRITMRASVLDVTPQDAADEATSGVQVAEAFDPAQVERGKKVFRKCKACHQVGETAKNRSGPQLNGIFGRAFASVEGFKYSKAFKSARDAGKVWDEAEMTAFLTKPRTYIKGTKMSFVGLKKPEDIEAVIAYLKSASR